VVLPPGTGGPRRPSAQPGPGGTARPVPGAHPSGPYGGAHPSGPYGGLHPPGPYGGLHPPGPYGGLHPPGPYGGAHPSGPYGANVPGSPGGTPSGPPRSALRHTLPLLISSAMLVLALVVAAVTWYGVHHRSAAAHEGLPPRTPTPTVTASGTGAEAVAVPVGVECGLPYGARCPSAPECYGPLSTTDGYRRGTVRPCDRKHSWEVFALGTVPAGQADLRPAAVRALPRVRAVCNEVVLFTRLPADQVIGWRVEVLPPTPQRAAAGDRTFRCLAGRDDGQLTGSVVSG
jgi:hypothetical protein